MLILTLILKIQYLNIWTGFLLFEQWTLTCFSKQGNEFSNCLDRCEFLDQLSGYYFLKRGFCSLELVLAFYSLNPSYYHIIPNYDDDVLQPLDTAMMLGR